MKAEVRQALEELKEGLPDHQIRVEPDADGGACIIVDGLDIGPAFDPSTSWVGFHITFSYPDADVYPHFISPEVRYVGQGPRPNQHPAGDLPTAMTRGGTMPGFEIPAIQVSRRSNRRNAGTDSALEKVLRVLDFLRNR
jgi:hypothetical protein